MTFAKEKYPAFDWIFERNIMRVNEKASFS